jgi:hypothetical protein
MQEPGPTCSEELAGDGTVSADTLHKSLDDESASGVGAELGIVVNWFGDLRRKMAGGSQ